MKLNHEETKCPLCNKAYVNSILMSVYEEKDEYRVICFKCANYVYKVMKSLKEGF